VLPAPSPYLKLVAYKHWQILHRPASPAYHPDLNHWVL